MGSGKFGLSAWVKINTLPASGRSFILHMTMSNSATPFDPTSTASGTQHLSRILSVAVTNTPTLDALATNLDNQLDTNSYGSFTAGNGVRNIHFYIQKYINYR